MILMELWTQLVMYPFVFIPDLIRRYQNNNANNVVIKSANSGSDGEDGQFGPPHGSKTIKFDFVISQGQLYITGKQ